MLVFADFCSVFAGSFSVYWSCWHLRGLVGFYRILSGLPGVAGFLPGVPGFAGVCGFFQIFPVFAKNLPCFASLQAKGFCGSEAAQGESSAETAAWIAQCGEHSAKDETPRTQRGNAAQRT